MTPNDHRAALFDALTLCERAWGKSLTQPSSDAIRAHDEARDQHHAAVEAMVRELEQAHEQIERMSLDLHAARNELQRAWTQQDAINHARRIEGEGE